MFLNFLHSSRAYSRDVKLYLLTSALLGFSYFGFVSVLLNLYLLRLGYDPAFIGLVNAGAPIAFASTSVPAGMLGKRIGSRKAVIIGITVLAISIGLLPLSELLPQAWRNAGFVFTRLLTGLGFALYQVNTNPYLVAATTEVERNQVFSLQIGLLSVAGFLGSVISGFLPGMWANWLGMTLAEAAPYRYPLLLASLLLLPAAGVLFLTNEAEYDQAGDGKKVGSAGAATVGEEVPNAPREDAATRALLDGPVPFVIIAVLALTATTRMAGEGAARTFFNVYLDAGLGISTATIGILTAIGQIVAGPAAMFAPGLVKRTDKTTTVVLATFGISLGLLLMGLIPHWIGVSIGFIGVVGMLNISRAITNVIYMEIVKPTWRSLTSGVTSAAMGVGFATATLGGGYVINAFGYRTLFFMGAISVAVSALLFWSYFRRPRGEYV